MVVEECLFVVLGVVGIVRRDVGMVLSSVVFDELEMEVSFVEGVESGDKLEVNCVVGVNVGVGVIVGVGSPMEGIFADVVVVVAVVCIICGSERVVWDSVVVLFKGRFVLRVKGRLVLNPNLFVVVSPSSLVIGGRFVELPNGLKGVSTEGHILCIACCT